MSELRQASDYTARQTDAARRVLIDVQQVLASFRDSIVLVGGWVPDLLIPDASEPHVGSIDVDLALDVQTLENGRYAELLKLLLDTRRYEPGKKTFQLRTTVNLPDGLPAINVDVDFLAAREVKLRGQKRMGNFRVLQADGCSTAFRAPEVIDVSGVMIDGVRNTVEVRVAALPDFLVMKCHALAGRDKPKDAYDIVYCLDNVPGGNDPIATVWRAQAADQNFARASDILRQKFATIDSYGPQRAAQFRELDEEAHAMAARRAYELVHSFLSACKATQ
ncbi:MAG: nucleotidyl transferase AbiEii/AbiGii toxin family protein [Opitutaceae bacterium]|jgi:predicted nucleotidyltransferase